jgi:hypothetical protein
MICPLNLLNVTLGIYYYQCVNCDNMQSVYTITANQPLTCGCDDPNNSGCIQTPGFPTMLAPGRPARGR